MEDLPKLYEGSVKVVRGPGRLPSGSMSGSSESFLEFEFTDSFSVFDWGKMPDVIPHKGSNLCRMGRLIFQELERPDTWKKLSATKEAQELRAQAKEWKVSGALSELGETLQKEGLRTHLLEGGPQDRMRVRPLLIERPREAEVLGKTCRVYPPPSAEGWRLIPLELVFRFDAPAGSSLYQRWKEAGEEYRRLGIPDGNSSAPDLRWAFPVMECFTKLESTDRLVSFQEALQISHLEPQTLERVFLLSAWVSTWLRERFGRVGLALLDGKFEWAVQGESLCLVDSVGPDELRLRLKNDRELGRVSFSKEFLREQYQRSDWYQELLKVKRLHGQEKSWRSLVKSPVPRLPDSVLKETSLLYALIARIFDPAETSSTELSQKLRKWAERQIASSTGAVEERA